MINRILVGLFFISTLYCFKSFSQDHNAFSTENPYKGRVDTIISNDNIIYIVDSVRLYVSKELDNNYGAFFKRGFITGLWLYNFGCDQAGCFDNDDYSGKSVYIADIEEKAQLNKKKQFEIRIVCCGEAADYYPVFRLTIKTDPKKKNKLRFVSLEYMGGSHD